MEDSARLAVWRRRIPAVLVAFACVAGVAIAVTGAAKPLPALQFLPVGHWVYNSSSQRAYHVDGGGAGVDEEVPVPGGSGSQVVQGDDDGYVVGNGRVTRFGKSTLSVDGAQPAPTGEIPIGIETVGGPYLVYRQQGRIVRLGDPLASMAAGDSVANPVVTAEGTVWLLRPKTGLLCRVDRGSDHVMCTALAPAGHTGALTMVGDQPTFVDTTASTAAAVTDGGLGPAVPLGAAVGTDAVPAPNDVAGKIALLQPQQHTMTFVAPGNAAVRPVTVQLPPGGRYDTPPQSTGKAAAVVDDRSHTLLTYGPDGGRLDAKPIPTPAPPAPATTTLSRGEDAKLYLDGADGSHVLVVGADGGITDVPVVGSQPGSKPGPGRKPAPASSPRPDRGGTPGTPGTPSPSGGQANPEPGGQQAPQPETGPSTGNQPSPAGRSEPTGPPPGSQGPQPGHQQPPPAKPKPPPQQQKPPPVPATPPGAPTGVTAAAGNRSITARWAPAAANRAPITQYTVTVTGGGRSHTAQTGGTGRSATVTGLTGGVRYTVSVVARNSAGYGPRALAGAPVTVVGAAGAPGVTAAMTGATAARVSWTPPNLGGGTLVGYQVTATGRGTQTTSATSMGYTGLPAGTTVTFTVRAITSGPGGGRITGAAGTASVRVPGQTTPPAGKQTIVAAVGDPKSSDNCDSDCHAIDVHLSGFTPGTTVHVYAMRMRGGHFDDTEVDIGADGTGDSSDMSVDDGNPSFYVQGGGATSNTVQDW